MALVTQRAQQARRSRGLLIDVALALYAEKGIEGTSMRDLAAAAGMSQGTIYHHFTDKDDLLVAVVEAHSFLPHLRRLLTAAGADNQPVSTILLTLAREFAALVGEHAQIVQVYLGDARTRPRVAQSWTAMMAEGVALLSGDLQRRVDAGDLRPHDTTVTARTLFFTILMLHLAGTPPDSFIPTFVDTLVRGMALGAGERAGRGGGDERRD